MSHPISSGLDPTPLEAPAAVEQRRRTITIGLPTCNVDGERRFPLTPEGAAMLIERGFAIRMQRDAAATIHYSDNAYVRSGVEIVGRDEALLCDIVIHLAPLPAGDVTRMRRGSMLLTLLHPCRRRPAEIKALLSRHIISIALDLVKDRQGNTPFADILSEIDGRAALAIAASLLADAVHGKGILLGGVAGIIPCETMIIGSGIAACAAAQSAAGAGSVVRIFDNDTYSLRAATRRLGEWAVGSVLHPRTVRATLRSADIVVCTDIDTSFEIDDSMVQEMKKGVVAFDLTSDCGRMIPSLPCVDLASARPGLEQGRCCYVNAGSAVPRTAAMALSNTLLTMLHDIISCDGAVNALRLLPGLQAAACTFLGRAVNPRIADAAGVRCTDINLYLTLS